MSKDKRKRTRGSRDAVLRDLERRFASLGVRLDGPGADLSPAFMRAEASDPELLHAYGRFIALRPRDAAYDDFVRDRVKSLADFLHACVMNDSREGACIDASMALGRMLDAEGVWNFLVKGSVKVTFPDELGSQYLWTLMQHGNPATAGHVWVCAPPFQIIDITLAKQPYPQKLKQHVGGYVLGEKPRRGSFTASDFAEPEVLEAMVAEGVPPTLESICRLDPSLAQRMKDLGCWEVHHARLRLLYMGAAVSISDGTLDALQTPIFSCRGRMEGFVLRECCDREYRFTACDDDLQAIVLQACKGRFEVTVQTGAKDPHSVHRLIIRG